MIIQKGIQAWNELSSDITRRVTSEAGSSNMPGKENGPYDAYRHALWIAEMTRLYGENVAKTIGYAHEIEGFIKKPSSITDSPMDLWNNEIGVQIGKNSNSWEDVVKQAREAVQRAAQEMNTDGSSNSSNGVKWKTRDSWSGNNNNAAPTGADQKPLPESQWNWPKPSFPVNHYPLPTGNYPRRGKFPFTDNYDYSTWDKWDREIYKNPLKQPHDKFWDARDYANRNYSPIILDLNNDGIIGSTNVRKQHTNFDFDGKNTILEGTAWIDANDGFLVLDKNNNGKIDNGSELFGDNTLLSNGKTAKDGIEAMQDLDNNKDGKLNALDTNFAKLKIWRDVNQNGQTDTGELKSLSDWGISEFQIKRGEKYNSNGDFNFDDHLGNKIESAGTFSINGKNQKMADVWFEADPFYNKFKDILPINDAAKKLADVEGMGAIRSLREAMTQSPALLAKATQLQNATTHAQKMAILDEVMYLWANTSGFAKTLSQQFKQTNPGNILTNYTVIFEQMNDSYRLNSTGQNSNWNLVDSNGSGSGKEIYVWSASPEYQALVDDFTHKLHVLEAINGRHMFDFNYLGRNFRSEIINATSQLQPGEYFSQGVGESIVVTLNIDPAMYSTFMQAYQGFKDAIYSEMLLQTTLQPYLEKTNIIIDETGIRFDATALNQFLDAQQKINPEKTAEDLLLIAKYAPDTFKQTGFDLGLAIAKYVPFNNLSPRLKNLFDEFKAFSLDNPYNPNNIIFGNSGIDTLKGNDGNDTLIGGTGNDNLEGGKGNDIYIFNKGDGQDIIYNNATDYATTQDTLQFGAGITKSDILFNREEFNLILSIKNSTDKVTIENYFNDDGLSDYSIQTIKFSDGSSLTRQDLLKMPITQNIKDDNYLYGWSGIDIINGSAGDDHLHGDNGDDTLNGNNGDDTLYGGLGNNILNGGAGDDILLAENGNNILNGGAGNDSLAGDEGNDIYLFNKGDGQDIIFNLLYNSSSIQEDTLQFGSGIAKADILVSRERTSFTQDNLILSIKNSTDKITIKHYFVSNYYYDHGLSNSLQNIKFIDGSSLTKQDLLKMPIALNGSSNDDNLDGWSGVDILNGGAGDDSLQGNQGNDSLKGGIGDDYLDGGLGNDTYLFAKGYGRDTIIDNSSIANQTDTLKITGATQSQLWLRKINNNVDLEVSIIGTTDATIIKDWYKAGSGSANHIEQIQANGKTLMSNNVDKLVQAMAAFAPPKAGQTTLPSDYANKLNVVLAANWK